VIHRPDYMVTAKRAIPKSEVLMKSISGDSLVKLGLVGLGDWGHQVALSAELDPGITISACYARSLETRISFAERYGCTSCSNYEEMLQDSTIEGIAVMSPNRAHRDQVVAAAAHGKHCLVTKPIATSIDDGRAMIRACEQAEVILAVGHQSRREPSLRRLRELLAAGDLGTPVLVECNISTGFGLGIQPDQWRWTRDECPGGPLIQLGIHHVDTLQYLFGPIVKVQGWKRRALVRADIDDVTCTLLEFESGLLGYLGSSYASSEACWIKIYGTIANAHYDQHLGLTMSQDSWEHGPVREQRATGTELKAPIPTMREEVAEFAECIRTGKKPDVDGVQALRNLVVVLAAIQSGETDNPVSVDDLLLRGGDLQAISPGN
jgi:predicted dehydrogenase